MSVYDFAAGRAERRRAVRPSPVFLGVLAITVAGAALAWVHSAAGSRIGDVGVFVFVLGGWVVSLCLHEFGHAFAAYLSGDREVEARGYLTLNPLRYAHPVLSIVLPLLFIVQGGIGLPGGAVYLHRHAFRRRWMQSAAALAGPASNVVFAVVLLALARAHGATTQGILGGGADHLRFWSAVAFLGFLQVTGAVLNLLPIPGLDGWAAIEPYADRPTVALADKVKPWGMIGVIVLLQIDTINNAFFRLVDWFYRLSGSPTLAWELGHQFFRFWVKNPF